MDLRGKVALVTGGAVRVGRSIALALADAGADVCFSYCKSADAAQSTEVEIRSRGRRALAVSADFKCPEDVKALVDAAVNDLGRLDVLVNSAAVWLRTPWATLKELQWDDALDITLRGPIFCAKYASPHLAAHGEGLIVNIVDLSAFMPFRGFSAHSAAKAGLLKRHSRACRRAGAGSPCERDRSRTDSASGELQRGPDPGQGTEHALETLGEARGRGDDRCVPCPCRLCHGNSHSRGWG